MGKRHLLTLNVNGQPLQLEKSLLSETILIPLSSVRHKEGTRLPSFLEQQHMKQNCDSRSVRQAFSECSWCRGACRQGSRQHPRMQYLLRRSCQVLLKVESDVVRNENEG
jgi:hypothetical protein